MSSITIPPEALEAGARAIYLTFTEVNIGDGEDHWERLLPQYRAEYRAQARAACLAMLAAWPGMGIARWAGGTVNLELPLPQEASDDR